MATLVITQTLDYLLPTVLHELIIEYYGIKDSINSNAISMCVYNNILYVSDYTDYVIAYDTDLNEIKKYRTDSSIFDMTVDEQYIYTIATDYDSYIEKIKKANNEKLYLSKYCGICITLYNNKLYINSCNDTKIMVISPESGTILETINTTIYTGYSTQGCKIMFRDDELFITHDYMFSDTKQLIIINNNYDIYTIENKIYLYGKNTLYKKDNNINVQLDDESISKLTPIDEIIVDINSFKSDESVSEMRYISNCIIKCMTATDNKIYACVEYGIGSKIIVYSIHKNKIKRMRK
jgi:hypothetical protein